MTTYYISGPMRGKSNYNRTTFGQVEWALRDWCDKGTYERGEQSTIINPAKNFGGRTDLPASKYLELDLQQVLSADVIVLLPGWRESEGARREVEVAIWAGKRFVEATWFDDDSLHTGWQFTIADISAATQTTSTRADVLDEAKSLITGDRNNAYGPPWQDFSRTAGILNALGYLGPNGRPLESHDTAIMVMAVKLSRLVWAPTRRDSWVDTAGYAGCGYECAVHDEEVRDSACAVTVS